MPDHPVRVKSTTSRSSVSTQPAPPASLNNTALLALLFALFATILAVPSARSFLAARTTRLVPLLRIPENQTRRTIVNPPNFAMPAKADNPNDPRWNYLAEGMDRYHAHFRWEFNRVYDLADGGFHKEGMSLPRFIREAAQLSQHLDMHHRIEAHIFPILGKKMPQFKSGARESGEHLKSHKQIHDGLDRYDAFLKAVMADSSQYSSTGLRGIMDGFRGVLFRHLDEEVHDLGAESMKAAGWTLAELRQIPM
ncbi:uncharacterized protein MKK02DRAFT_43210 [Dioszegia hungarica]|uniref:Hemerythrin-like domain-containing protein n=1 Tax=Dioszegia hungarica TaxID=4972 RepID=A0AA38LTY7_9TREE|nr:uncharacterized protein MKK02DRAFT_43210 [Dioszegia hungarica]KAI9637287.1 hypothetical protein MKK02DRAFT_43210 [Dioszegia hungarica]